MKGIAFAFGLSLLATPVLADECWTGSDGLSRCNWSSTNSYSDLRTDAKKLCDAIRNAGVPLASKPTVLNFSAKLDGPTSAVQFNINCGEEK